MRQLVFADATARQRLEAIVHPLVSEVTRRLLAEATSGCVILDIPLLVESGRWRKELDAVVVVDCKEATQKVRVAARSGLTEEAVARIMDSQADRLTRISCADAVIFNEGLTMDLLRGEVHQLACRFGL